MKLIRLHLNDGTDRVASDYKSELSLLSLALRTPLRRAYPRRFMNPPSGRHTVSLLCSLSEDRLFQILVSVVTLLPILDLYIPIDASDARVLTLADAHL